MQSTIVKSERKTKSKRQKENYDEISSDIDNKKHYVLYPGDDDGNGNENQVKSTRVLRRHTLEEQNINITNPITLKSTAKIPKNTRKSKKSKMVVESVTDITYIVTLDTDVKPKVKKNKKKKQIIVHDILESNDEIIKKTVSNTKISSSDGIEGNPKNSVLNASMDSFHSAAVSPRNNKFNVLGTQNSEEEIETDNPTELLQAVNKLFDPSDGSLVSISSNDSRIDNIASPILIDSSANDSIVLNTPKEQEVTEKYIPITSLKREGTYTKEKNTSETYNVINVTLDPSDGSLVSISSNDSRIDNLASPILIDSSANGSIVLNTPKEQEVTEKYIPITSLKREGTYTKEKNTSETYNVINVTLDSSDGSLVSISSNDSRIDNLASPILIDSSANDSILLNTPKEQEVTEKYIPITSLKREGTYTKEKNTSETYNVINVTLDPSDDSLVSISSNDSRIDNLASPILIDSSANDSIVLNTPKEQEVTEKYIPITSLKREGTYTKENTNETQGLEQSEINPSKCSNHRVSLDETSKRRKSLPSPGCKPFIGAKSSEKRNILNLTYSIEKPARTSSLFQQSTKTTGVMFCSPVSYPVVASQAKRKVIKSGLKGSNKSFLFNDTTSETRRPGTRKRSFTQNVADGIQTKRVRLVDEQQQSTDRLSRPRTVSAVAKLSEPSTPSKKTKPEAKSTRTKLPYFVALHQKRFEKMESLDKCQERKAMHARQFLAPTGSVNLLERISPKEKVPDSPKSALKETLKPDTPYRPKLFTLGSVNPGYTRFRFKLNCAVNPFTATDKQVEVETRKTKPGLINQATQTLAGATSVRKFSAAKQSVMRETSLTCKSDTKGNENRTVIKGVRTNRRFDLQMQMKRNIH